MKKLKVERSSNPDDEGTHVLFLYSNTERGCSIKRIFKGTYKECQEEKRRLESANG